MDGDPERKPDEGGGPERQGREDPLDELMTESDAPQRVEELDEGDVRNVGEGEDQAPSG